MSGAVAANFHEASRSEQYADFVFSAWGTVTPVRRQDDTGVDLFCTLTDRVGQRAIVTDHFVVQVKSNGDPWVFETREAVAWLVNYPQPLFLACVNRRDGTLTIYHVMPRFYAGALPPIPDRLELVPEDGDDGLSTQWRDRTRFSLGAPIVRITVQDLFNEQRMQELKEVLRFWVRADRENCDLRRQGILRFRMPHNYRVNDAPLRSGIVEAGHREPADDELNRAIVVTAEGAEAVGAYVGNRGDRAGALLAALFLDHLQRNYPRAFEPHLRWNTRVPGELSHIVVWALRDLVQGNYLYAGLDAITAAVLRDPLVDAFVNRRS